MEKQTHRRVLIVDDQQLFAETLKRSLIFEKFSRVEFETSSSAPRILKKVEEFKPELILMDIHMNELDGFSLTQNILAKYPDIIVLMLTAFGYEDYMQKAMQIGASGILLKDVSMEELIHSICWATKDNFIVSNKRQLERNSRDLQDKPEWFSHLSDRDIEMLRLIARGFSNDEIAQTMNLGKQTVKNYISRLYTEMKVTNRFQAIRTILEVMPEYNTVK